MLLCDGKAARSRLVYSRLPFRAMDAPFEPLNAEGWHSINMFEIAQLVSFATDSAVIQSVFDVCYNSILSTGSIMIEPEDAPRAQGDGTSIVLPTAQEENAMHARSSVFAKWGREGAFLEECIGWYPTSSVPTPGAAGGDYLPVVMNLARMRVMHRVDVFGQHSWRWFEVAGMQTREIVGITVMGSSLPDNYGRLSSKVKRVMHGEWAIYQLKVRLTMEADSQRAHPTVVTQAHEERRYDPLSAAGAAHPGFEQTIAAQRAADEELTDPALRVHALVRTLNTCAAGARAVEAARTFEIDAGRTYVNVRSAEAPAELAVARQAFLESCCLAWGIPMAMISSGDATGKARLNSATASPETARIFREAQSARKHRLEGYMRDMYDAMFKSQHAQRYLQGQLEAKYKRLKLQHEGEPDIEALLADDEATSHDAISKSTRMRVQIPCNPQNDMWVERLRLGVIKYADFARIDSMQMGVPLSSYNERRLDPDAKRRRDE